MPSTTHHPATANSFLGLQSYTEAQSNSFFGRDAETDTLTGLIELNTLTIVFGRSGTGKTSLLNAGVFPRLRKSFCLPFRIRLEFNDNSPDLLTQIKKVLKEEIDKYGFKVESYPSAETLWEYFHKEPLWKTVTPILVFDQFEEIFTLARSNLRFAATELPIFWEELSDLIENNIPERLKSRFLNQKEAIGYNYKKQKAKIVFAFREEYLPEFESITSRIPSLKYSRFRLLPMNGNQAYEVITKTWQENINPSEARRLVSYFTIAQGINDYNLITVEPSLLSQVCAYIDKERIDSGGGKLSAELLNKYPKEAILRSIYEEAVMQANNSIQKNEPGKRNVIKEFVEEKLITTEGFRTRYHLAAVDEPIRPGINVLVTKYFVREDDNIVELTHDVVAPIIKTDREKRRKEIEVEKLRAKTRKRVQRFLLLFLLAAGITYAAVVWKAQMERDKLALKALAFKTLITNDSTRLEIFKKAIVADSLELERLKTEIRKRKPGEKTDDPITTPETVNDDLENIDTLLRRLNNLSKDFADLNLNNENDIKKLLEIKKRPLIPLIPLGKYDSLTNSFNVLKYRFDTLENSYIRLFDSYNLLHGEISRVRVLYDQLLSTKNSLELKNKELEEDNKKLRRQIADLIRNCQYPALPCPSIDTTNSLKLQLNYTQTKEYYPSLLPDKIRIYMIPFAVKNMSLIRTASTFDQCDESKLANAEGSISGQYCNSYFIFPNVKPGMKYLVKICTLYGNYVVYEKKSAGAETIKLDAVPPVKRKNR